MEESQSIIPKPNQKKSINQNPPPKKESPLKRVFKISTTVSIVLTILARILGLFFCKGLEALFCTGIFAAIAGPFILVSLVSGLLLFSQSLGKFITKQGIGGELSKKQIKIKPKYLFILFTILLLISFFFPKDSINCECFGFRVVTTGGHAEVRSFYWCFGIPYFCSPTQQPPISQESPSVSENEAVTIVTNLPEVERFLRNIPNAKITIELESTTDNYWSIHVYESFPSYNATFNWYQVDKQTGKVTSSFPSQSTSTWKDYTNTKIGLNLKFPSDFILSHKDEEITIHSPTKLCRLKGTKDVMKNTNEVRINIKYHEGNYEQIWGKTFGFKFGSYDGIELIDGKKAHFFYQGAEMEFGRKAYLVKLTPTSALEINIFTPSYTFECEDGSLDQYKSIEKQILSTFKFLE